MDENNEKPNSSAMLENMDLDQLKELLKTLDRAIASYETRIRKEALSALELAAKEHGFKLADLMSDRSSDKPRKKSGEARSPAPVTYVNPENPEQTWSGRGRRPQWVKDALEAGRTLDDLAA